MMKNITIKAYAKINLSLDVIKKRYDGYHEVKMIMQQVDLCDKIYIEILDIPKIQIKTNLKYLPNDKENIAYRAAEIFLEKQHISKGIRVDIIKGIPVSAGLAGGSTDAAAVLKGLNHLWQQNLTISQLMEMGKKIGADVPFCILGGSAVAEGIGENLTPIKGMDVFVVLCKPNIRISTAEVYQKLCFSKIHQHPNVDQMVSAIQQQKPLEEIRKNMINVLETVTIGENPIVYKIKKKMMQCQAEASLMSGSGPTVFGLFKDYNRAKSAYENLKKLYNDTFLVKTINTYRC